MAAVKNQTASVTSVVGDNQRRLLLEVLRANLRGKNTAAAGGPCEQQASAHQNSTQHPVPICPDLCGVTSTLAGAGGFRSALAQKLERLGKGGEGSIHSAAVARDVSRLQACATGRTTVSEVDSVHTARSCAAENGEAEKVSVGSNGSPAAGEPVGAERVAEEGGGQQGLSIALFAKLAEGLPKDQGKLHFLTWGDGSCYCGHLSGGSLDGIGVYRYTDNSIYCGQWVRDHLQGHGAFITPSGFLYRGSFEADKQHGAGIFVVPNGRTFFGTFRRGRLHGLSCCVSVSGSSWPLLGEWRDGEFQRVFPLHARVADFYVRAAESLDLLGSCWNPLPVPVPDSSVLGLAKGEVGAQGSCARDQQLCSVAVLEALRTELPKSLLQVAAASAADDDMVLPSEAERHVNDRLTCSGKSVVRKRKASLLRPQGRDGREAVAASKSRCQEAASNGVTHPPQRATTTKAQLLRWESEARKLPRIPHLNYNRVLGRWYARVRDPTSGRRIWKGYTCAVHGFYQARDMAIDRLRQFSQLVSPLASAEPENATAEDMPTPLTSDPMTVQVQVDRADSETCTALPESSTAVAAVAACSSTGIPLAKRRETSASIAPLVGPASDSASCSLDLAASDAGSGTAAPGDMSGCEKSAVEDNDDDGHVGVQARKDEMTLNRTKCAGFAAVATHVESTTLATHGRSKQHLSMSQSSAHSLGTEPSGALFCRPDTVVAQEGESIACSRLTTADCTESALSRCTPLQI